MTELDIFPALNEDKNSQKVAKFENKIYKMPRNRQDKQANSILITDLCLATN